MDDKKGCSSLSELHMDEGTDNGGTSEMKEEKQQQPSHATLDEKEVIERDENGCLVRPKKDPEGLESVQEYAKRIKSFLGWEPNLEEEGSVKERCRSPGEVDDGNGASVTGDPCSDTAVEGVDNKSTEEEENACPTTDVPPKTEQSKGGAIEFDGSNGSLKGVRTEVDLTEISESISKREDMDGTDQNLQGAVEDSKKVGLKDIDGLNSAAPFETETNLAKSSEMVHGIKDDNNSGVKGGETEMQTLESDCKIKIDSLTSNTSKDLLESALLPSDNGHTKSISCLSGTSDGDAEKPVSNDVSAEVRLLEENPMSDYDLDDAKVVSGVENSVLCESGDNRRENGSTDDERAKIKETEIETRNTDNVKDGDSEETSNATMACADNSKEKYESPDAQSQKMMVPEKLAEDITNHEIKINGDTENIDSDDSVYLDEDIPLKNNIQKSYMDGIRRLSVDIVKDVIQSARNSVHELYALKNKDVDTGKISDSLEICQRKDESKDSNGQTSESKNINLKCSPDDPSFKDYKKLFQVNDNKDEIGEDIADDNGITDDEIVCGYGCFKPEWIQKYARPKVYLVLFSIIGVIHGCYYPYFVSVISTLEKRYAFKTKVSGTLLLADEITPLILGIFVGYIGGRTHRPRMVALGMFMSVACCFISGLPYVIYGSAKHLSSISYQNATGPDVCKSGPGKSSLCDSDDLPPTLTVVGIFLLASFLKGFATLSYYVIGISYMDDNIKKKNSPLYLAIALALRLLGPLVGFLMSSGFLKLYENPVDDPGFGPDDPRWIGAWWIGFFLQGVLLMIFTLPIALFPRRLPDQKTMEKSTSPAKEDSLKEIFAGLLSALKRLGLNPVFIVMIINTTMKIFGHFGHAIMLPKYMENQFRLSASEASLFSGATTIACIMISTVLGGFLIWKFRPTIKVLLAGMITSEVILCAGFLILMIPRCHTTDMLNFGMGDEGLILNSACNQNCDCSTTSFTPFCGPDGKTTYFSPCYAGCTQELISSTLSKKSKEFGNCSCVAAATAQPQVVASISEGFCPDENCWSQTLAYLIILFFLVTTSNLFTVAHTMILLRSVHPNDKSVALGTFETFICLFGFIPFPVTFGALVDSACLVWEKSCGETGNCWFYDMEKYAYLLHGASALFCAFSVVCLLTLYFLSSRVRNLYTDEEDDADFTDIKLDTVSGSVTKL